MDYIITEEATKFRIAPQNDQADANLRHIMGEERHWGATALIQAHNIDSIVEQLEKKQWDIEWKDRSVRNPET